MVAPGNAAVFYYFLVVLRPDGKDSQHGRVCILMSIGNETKKNDIYKKIIQIDALEL